MFSQFFVFSLDWNFWSSKYMKRDLYDNFFENTELLGKTLEKRFAGEYKLKKKKRKQGKDWRRICPIKEFKSHKRFQTFFWKM